MTDVSSVAEAAAAIEAYCADLGGITPGLARALAEVAASVLAGKVTPVMRGELPLRVIDTGHGYAIRALCGRESAVWADTVPDRGAGIVRAAHGTGVRNRSASPDATPMAVIKLAIHTKTCAQCQARQYQV
jgi:hypothetical protein